MGDKILDLIVDEMHRKSLSRWAWRKKRLRRLIRKVSPNYWLSFWKDERNK